MTKTIVHQNTRVPEHQGRLVSGALVLYLFWIFSGVALGDGLSVDPGRSILDAKQIAIGRSGSALEKEPFLLFNNPAGLAGITYPKISSTSRKIFFDETQYINMGGAVPMDFGTIGFAILDAQTGGSFQTKRDGETDRIIPNPSKEAISFDSNILLVSYAKKDVYKKGLNVGANLKLYNQGFGGGAAAHASAWGIDVAGQYRILPYLNLGLTFQNILNTGLGWSSGAQNSLGSQIKIGAAANLLGKKETSYKENSQELLGTLDLDFPSSAFHLGFEWLAQPNLHLRAGYDSTLGLSYGLGLNNFGFRFDYAYAASPYAAGDNPHYFTISYVGDLVKIVSKKLVREDIAIKLITHKDKEITTAEAISFRGEANYKKTFDQITSWVVPSISSKDDHLLVTEEAKLIEVKINSKPLNVVGTFEAEEKLGVGRNIFYFEGKIPGKGSTYEAFRVLRVYPFADVPVTHWAYEPIALVSNLKIIKGYPENRFMPDKGITRAELVALLLRAQGITIEKIEKISNPFNDVKEEFWSAPFILKGVDMKIVTGYPDGTFKPDKILSRTEGITIISRYTALPEKDKAVFPDLKEGFWANKYIAPAYEAGLLKYLNGKNFEPARAFTRAEATEVLYETKMVQNLAKKFWDTGKTIEDEIIKTSTPSKEAAGAKPK